VARSSWTSKGFDTIASTESAFVGGAVLGRQMRREHQDLAAKGRLAELLDELDPGHSRHAVVGDQQVEAIGFRANAGERLPPLGHDLDLAAIAFQREGDGEGHGAFVFGEQDAKWGKPLLFGVHGGGFPFLSEIEEERQQKSRIYAADL